MDLFRNKRIVIATKHGKEKVIAPLLEKEFGAICFVPKDFDTDLLGTFTGEIERASDPLTTLKQKCRMAMKLAGVDAGIASEGSFGPHPDLFFMNAGDELVVLIDEKSNLEIVARELSTETNFAGAEIKNFQELKVFAEKTGFASHAMILRKQKDDATGVIKDITTWDGLEAAYEKMRQQHQTVFAETDMRAMNNPTRMKAIEKAAAKLVEKIKSACPQCGTAGFSVTDARPGLPCSWCGTPTRSLLAHIYSCTHCGHTEEKMYPYKKEKEDPMYCDYCNP